MVSVLEAVDWSGYSSVLYDNVVFSSPISFSGGGGKLHPGFQGACMLYYTDDFSEEVTVSVSNANFYCDGPQEFKSSFSFSGDTLAVIRLSTFKSLCILSGASEKEPCRLFCSYVTLYSGFGISHARGEVISCRNALDEGFSIITEGSDLLIARCKKLSSVSAEKSWIKILRCELEDISFSESRVFLDRTSSESVSLSKESVCFSRHSTFDTLVVDKDSLFFPSHTKIGDLTNDNIVHSTLSSYDGSARVTGCMWSFADSNQHNIAPSSGSGSVVHLVGPSFCIVSGARNYEIGVESAAYASEKALRSSSTWSKGTLESLNCGKVETSLPWEGVSDTTAAIYSPDG